MAQVAKSTRLSERLQVRHPVICAAMDGIAGGKLAAAVSSAGGLGCRVAVTATRRLGSSVSSALPATSGSAAASSPGPCAASLAGVILERRVAEAEQILARGPMIAGAGS
jgi:NAD(P)H-dependent flavin oxidoreductase YrpB (nitropropane dioxygenase family)